MSDMQQNDNKQTARKDDATDDRTLEDIEREEKLPPDTSDSQTPSPDEGAGREADDDADAPV